jgi:hypothetical protein
MADRTTDALLVPVTANDEPATLQELDRLLAAGTPPNDVLRALVAPAARALQLHYATPHAMIAVEWTRFAVEHVDGVNTGALLEACVRYIASCPKANLRLGDPVAPGEPDVDDAAEGLRTSLGEHRVFDALFYATRLPDGGDLTRELLTLAGHEVDGLGHVFIHTATALRILDWCDPADRPLVLLAMMEFLSRRAEIEEPSLLTEERPLPPLIGRSFDRIGILGHNVIYAAELHRMPGGFPDAFRQHLYGQLARNIANAELELTRDVYQDYGGTTAPGDAPPLDLLRTAFGEGDPERTLRAFVSAWAHPESRREIPATLISLFARLDVPQSHYLIYPAATVTVLDAVDDIDAEFGLAQLAHYGARAAGRYGLRPKRDARGSA